MNHFLLPILKIWHDRNAVWILCHRIVTSEALLRIRCYHSNSLETKLYLLNAVYRLATISNNLILNLCSHWDKVELNWITCVFSFNSSQKLHYLYSLLWIIDLLHWPNADYKIDLVVGNLGEWYLRLLYMPFTTSVVKINFFRPRRSLFGIGLEPKFPQKASLVEICPKC